MLRLGCIGLLFLALLGCGEKDKAVAESEAVTVFYGDSLSKKSNPSPKAGELLQKWPEYNALETSMEGLYRAEGKDALGIAVDDLIEKQKLLVASEYPKAFNVSHVKSRQQVFHTYLLQIKFDLESQLPVKADTEKLVTAYNAVVKQFDVIANNELDSTLLLLE